MARAPAIRSRRNRTFVRYCLRLLAVAVLAFVPAALLPGVTAQPAPQRVDMVARVVFSLLGYARWPAERESIRLCVDNTSRYPARLLEGATLSSGRQVRTRAVDVMADPLASQCDALYLGAMTDVRRQRLAAELAGRPVLVISEEDFECETGSMFCLNIREGQVSFRVNLDALGRSGVHVHPAVLQLGRRRGASS